MANNLSIPLAFVCLLHLANEKVSAACAQQTGQEQRAKHAVKSTGSGALSLLHQDNFKSLFHACRKQKSV